MRRVFPLPIAFEPDPWEQARRRRRKAGSIVLGVLMLAVLFFVLHFTRHLTNQSSPDTKGTITSTGESGNWTMHVNECSSGQLYSYFGVHLDDKNTKGTDARIVLPETGEPHITASIPGTNQEMTFPRSLCSAWDVDVHPNHILFNGVRELQGHAKFTCAVPDGAGGTITGDVTFDYCT